MVYVYLVTNLLDEVSLFLQFFFESINLFLIRHLELLFDERAMLFENIRGESSSLRLYQYVERNQTNPNCKIVVATAELSNRSECSRP